MWIGWEKECVRLFKENNQIKINEGILCAIVGIELVWKGKERKVKEMKRKEMEL